MLSLSSASQHFTPEPMETGADPTVLGKRKRVEQSAEVIDDLMKKNTELKQQNKRLKADNQLLQVNRREFEQAEATIRNVECDYSLVKVFTAIAIWSKVKRFCPKQKVGFLSNKANFELLPVEIVEKIFFHLVGRDFCNAKLACQKWYGAASNPSFCKKFVEAYVPEYCGILDFTPVGEEWREILKTVHILFVQRNRTQALVGKAKKVEKTGQTILNVTTGIIVISSAALCIKFRDPIYECFKAFHEAAKNNPVASPYGYNFNFNNDLGYRSIDSFYS